MNRTCFWCHKPLPVEQRATVFCSPRCQELEAGLRAQAAPGAARGKAPQPRASSVPRPQGATR